MVQFSIFIPPEFSISRGYGNVTLGKNGLNVKIKTPKQRQNGICSLEIVWTIGQTLAPCKFYKCVTFIYKGWKRNSFSENIAQVTMNIVKTLSNTKGSSADVWKGSKNT